MAYSDFAFAYGLHAFSKVMAASQFWLSGKQSLLRFIRTLRFGAPNFFPLFRHSGTRPVAMAQSPMSKWGQGRGAHPEVQVPDVWSAQKKVDIREDVFSKARELGLDPSTPAGMLDPATPKFNYQHIMREPELV